MFRSASQLLVAAMTAAAFAGCATDRAETRETPPETTDTTTDTTTTEPTTEPAEETSTTPPAEQPGDFEERDEASIFERAEERVLATQVRLTLLREIADDALQIGIEVKGDDVILSGTVDSEATREEAVRVVRELDNVDKVRAQLDVRAPGEDITEARAREARERARVNDEVLASQLELYLLQELGTDAVRVNVDVENGEAVLRGSVPDQQAVREAEGLLRDVEGVRRVENRLEVQPTGG